MTKTTATWAIIDRIASELGILRETRKKWRQRGVPHRWRLPILQKANDAGETIPAGAFNGASKHEQEAA
jgi:hypothetical protein